MIKLVNGRPVEMTVAEIAEYNAVVKEYDDAALGQAIGLVKRLAGLAIEAKYPTYKQLNLLRDGPPEAVEAMKSFINSIRQQSDVMEYDLEAMTVAEIRAYKPTFV